MNRPVTIALVGAGARGELNLATLAKKHPGLLKFTAVAELDGERRARFCDTFGIPEENAFADWRELFEKPRLADAVINALPCRMHYESTLAAMKAGYHNLLEKPMALKAWESVHLVDVASQTDTIFMVSLQSRYNRIYTRVNELLRAGRVGRLMSIDCAENIGYWHFVLSYVRGIHHREDFSHSFVAAKGVHDLDLIQWLAGAPAQKIASFGELSFFREENAPKGAPERCIDGCPVQEECPFDAVKQFLKPGRPDIPVRFLLSQSLESVKDFATNPRLRTMASVILRDISKPSIEKALRETMNGVCAYRCDNDVADHQTISIEFENGVTASYQLNAFSLIWERLLNLHGTKGEIRSADYSGRLETRTYLPAKVEKERIRYHGIFHGGGDETLVVRFAEAVAAGNREPLLSGANTVESHLLCFAAEEARKNSTVVDMNEFRKRARAEIVS